MKKILIRLLFLIQVIVFTSCLTTKQTNLLREPGGDIPTYPKTEVIGEYKIKPGDELNITVKTSGIDQRTDRLYSIFTYQGGNNESSKLRSFAVSPSGNIYFPYLGDIQVAGKTTLEVQQLLTSRFDDSVLKSSYAIVSLGNRYFSVIGESGVGRYQIEKEQTTIFQALAKSRDIRAYGDRSKVKIIRQTDTGTIIKSFDVRSEDIINSEFYYIQPNDVIYVQPLGRQFLGINSFGSIFALFSTILSVGLMVYSFVK